MTIERFVAQLDGSSMASFNCSAASDAMWLYRASQGKISTTGGHIRTLTGDTSGGLNLDEVQTVNIGTYGIGLGRVYRPIAFSTLKGLLSDGRHGAIVQGGYSAIRGTKYDCDRGQFSGGHAIYVSRTSGGQPYVGDPLADGRYPGCPDGWQTYSWSLLGEFCDRLPLSAGVTLASERGPGYAYAYVTPADPLGVAPTYTATVKVRTSLWNDATKRWVYRDANRLPIGTVLAVRGARYFKAGVGCYPVIGPAKYTPSYFVPQANVRLS